MNYILFVLLTFSLYLPLHAQEFSAEESELIRKAKTGKWAFYHGQQSKELIRLMNLARTHPSLCAKYIHETYEVDSARIYQLVRYRKYKSMEFLRPDFGLHLASLFHALTSGISGSTGHQAFKLRLYLTMNFAKANGENCEYGSNRAVDIFMNLMSSSGHKANILNPAYKRVGVSKKWHAAYRRNTVQMFASEALWNR